MELKIYNLRGRLKQFALPTQNVSKNGLFISKKVGIKSDTQKYAQQTPPRKMYNTTIQGPKEKCTT